MLVARAGPGGGLPPTHRVGWAVLGPDPPVPAPQVIQDVATALKSSALSSEDGKSARQWTCSMRERVRPHRLAAKHPDRLTMLPGGVPQPQARAARELRVRGARRVQPGPAAGFGDRGGDAVGDLPLRRRRWHTALSSDSPHSSGGGGAADSGRPKPSRNAAVTRQAAGRCSPSPGTTTASPKSNYLITGMPVPQELCSTQELQEQAGTQIDPLTATCDPIGRRAMFKEGSG